VRGGGDSIMTYSLFDFPPYQNTPTSIDAAIQIAPQAESLRQLVYQALKKLPMTDEEIAESCKLAPNTARPRRVELVKEGKVIQVGTAKTKSGRTAILWGAV